MERLLPKASVKKTIIGLDGPISVSVYSNIIYSKQKLCAYSTRFAVWERFHSFPTKVVALGGAKVHHPFSVHLGPSHPSKLNSPSLLTPLVTSSLVLLDRFMVPSHSCPSDFISIHCLLSFLLSFFRSLWNFHPHCLKADVHDLFLSWCLHLL